jgi:hypothetical protein
MNGHDAFSAQAPSFLERFEAFRQSDREREAFVTDLVQKYQELQVKYQEKCGDYENEVESRRIWQSSAKQCQTELLGLRQASVSCNSAYIAHPLMTRKTNRATREVTLSLWSYSTETVR